MITKRELMLRICDLEAEVDYLMMKLEDKPKKKITKKVKKNEK